ncbi:hypothetical protein STRIP9103_05451, partial [Streptomyces ipomoeae 91-03]
RCGRVRTLPSRWIANLAVGSRAAGAMGEGGAAAPCMRR